MEVAVVLSTLVVSSINALALVLGRTGGTRPARVAFNSGLVALSAFPLAFVAALVSFVPAPLDGPAPLLLILCLVVLVGATLCSFAMLLTLLRRTGAGSTNATTSPRPSGAP